MSSGLLVIPGVSTLPCVTLMLSLKTIILKYLLVCVFLVSPCCGHRNINSPVAIINCLLEHFIKVLSPFSKVQDQKRAVECGRNGRSGRRAVQVMKMSRLWRSGLS